MTERRKKRWSDLGSRQRTAVLVAGSVQLSLAVTAWVDLARRDPAEVNGSKGKWAAIIAINWIGPIAYFIRGRKHPVGADGPRRATLADRGEPVIDRPLQDSRSVRMSPEE
jgi:hypothetical protein